MACSKISPFLAAVCLVAAVFLPGTVRAEEKKPTAAQLANISAGCSGIKQSLTKLQRADSRTRIYLGAAYETISNNFITPLSLRLVKNNRSEPDLFDVQADFSSEQNRFRAAYTDYMRELEALLAVDCQANPADFYAHLETTRSRRAALRETTLKLNDLISREASAVKALQESL